MDPDKSDGVVKGDPEKRDAVVKDHPETKWLSLLKNFTPKAVSGKNPRSKRKYEQSVKINGFIDVGREFENTNFKTLFLNQPILRPRVKLKLSQNRRLNFVSELPSVLVGASKGLTPMEKGKVGYFVATSLEGRDTLEEYKKMPLDKLDQVNLPFPDYAERTEFPPTETQKEIRKYVLELENNSKGFILVEGPGGSGKSEMINYFLRDGLKVFYITTKHMLIREVTKQFKCKGSTFASEFLKLFQLTPFRGLFRIMPFLSKLTCDHLEEILASDCFNDLGSPAVLENLDAKKRLVVVIDEYTMISVLPLLLFIHGLNRLASNRLIIILIGDPIPARAYRACPRKQQLQVSRVCDKNV